jgi:hemerythrin-like domain-containing protein
MTEVIRVLRREHANMFTLINTLQAHINAFARDEKPDYDVIRAVLNYFRSFPDLYHHPKEDLVFARLQARHPASAGRIGDLRRQHEDLAASSRELAEGIAAVLDEAEVSRDSIISWARDFITLQLEHMEMEEKLFFPNALRHLTATDWRELEAVMTDQEDPLFGEDVQQPFEDLYRKILSWHADQRR